MEATIVQDKTKHYPVLLKEIISIITPQYGGTFIDCTFGQGGYTREILKNNNNKVIGFDRDSESLKAAKEIEKEFPGRFIFKNLNFSKLGNLKLKNENVRGVLFDLGYSFTQIKDPQKGLSFNSSGSLDMRMGLNEFSAKEVINKLDGKSLVENTTEDEESSYTQEAVGDLTNEDEIKNDLKEFGVDNDAPDLFSSENETSSTENLLSQENENQEDDLEIPAFLRRQKN